MFGERFRNETRRSMVAALQRVSRGTPTVNLVRAYRGGASCLQLIVSSANPTLLECEGPPTSYQCLLLDGPALWDGDRSEG